jgi:hypothetical protein
MLKQSETLNILPIAQASLFVYRVPLTISLGIPHASPRPAIPISRVGETWGEGERYRNAAYLLARKLGQINLKRRRDPSPSPGELSRRSVGLILQRKQLTGDSSPSSCLLRDRGRSACQGFSAVRGATESIFLSAVSRRKIMSAST